jgi:hypothetical protein
VSPHPAIWAAERWLEHDPEKHVLDVIGDGHRFSEKIMLHKKAAAQLIQPRTTGLEVMSPEHDLKKLCAWNSPVWQRFSQSPRALWRVGNRSSAMLPKRKILRDSVLGVALGAALTILPASAAPVNFDGQWSVLIITDQGACDRAYRYGVQIQNGQVSSNGSGADIAGHVTPRGQVSVRVRQGNQEAVGSGRLTQASGSGRWSGASPEQQCAGHWIAERRG